jgi:hypothetical protein
MNGVTVGRLNFLEALDASRSALDGDSKGICGAGLAGRIAGHADFRRMILHDIPKSRIRVALDPRCARGNGKRNRLFSAELAAILNVRKFLQINAQVL